jgi:hypothetical protein
MKQCTLITATFASIFAFSSAQAGTVSVGKTAPTTPPVPANPLSFAGGKLVFDFQDQARAEYRDNNFDFNDGLDSPTDDSWLLNRVRLGMKYKATDWLTFYAQVQDAREYGSDRPNVIGQMGAEGDDSFDLLEGWVEVGNAKSTSFRVGRQKLNFGDQRIVGPLEWLNVSRTFDAAKLKIVQPTWTLDLWTSSVVPFVNDQFNESDILSDAPRNQLFSGAYWSSTGLVDFQKTDLYLLHLSEDTPTGDTSFFTLGTLWKGLAPKLNNFDYTVEAMFQFGDLKGKDLQAFASHVDGGYNFVNTAWKPRIGAEYNFGSGDDNLADGTNKTFQNLFPTNHLFYGFMDLFSLQNLHNIALNVSANPTSKLKLTADYHAFWQAEGADNWYRVNGVATVRTPNPKASSFLGTELDLTFTYKYNPNLSFHGGFSHFFAGDWLKASGPADDANFVWLQARVDF